MRILLVSAFAFCLLALSGCVSYSYEGKTADVQPGEVAVFSDSAKIGKNYIVLGKAVVSGNYQHVTRDRMVAKLRDEAKKCGADAVLIVEQQILPENMLSSAPQGGFFTAYDFDSSSRSWGELYRDVDLTIGNIGQKSSDAAPASISDYKRVLRAEFLRYTSEKNLSPEVKK